MRDLVVFLIVVLMLPIAFRRPFMGLLLFSWLAYMRPQDLCWNFARAMRFSYFAGLTMLVGWMVNELGRRPFFRADIRTVAMIVLLFVTSVSLSLAEVQDEYVLRYFFEFTKIIVIALFTTGQVDSKQRLRILTWMIALCLGFYGFKGGLFGILRGGGVIMRGPGGMLEDNNDFALGLVMNIPLLFYLGRSEKSALLRMGCDLTIVFTMITVLLTHSRGAFVAMVGMLLLMAWRSGRLFQALGVLTLGALAFVAFAPTHVLERLASIGEGAAESSAGARIKAWTIAFRMIDANPWLGVGLRNFQEHWERHGEGLIEPGQSFAYVAHNSYLQIWAEGGTLSFAIYLVLLFSVFFTCRWVRTVARRRADLDWAMNYARMMETTTFGFMIGAVFLNRGHFDLIYHWLGLLTCLHLIVRRELRQAPVTAESSARAGPVEVQVRVRRPTLGSGRLLPTWGR